MDDDTVHERLVFALARIAGDTSNVRVLVKDGSVTLSGAVAAWIDSDEAERVAWSTPGVRKVENRLVFPQDTGTAEVEDLP